MTRLRSALAMGVVVTLVACQAPSTASDTPEGSPMTDSLTVTSSAFDAGGSIPSRFTCDDADVSPPLAWSGAPDGTAAYALIVDDPDARGWIHWTVADLEVTELAEGETGGVEGRNDFGRSGWGGPCPPSGTHRYVFSVYALSQPLNLPAGFTADDLREAMTGRVLGEGRLTASYQRGS